MDATTEKRLIDQLEIEDIKTLKHRYMRFMMLGEIESMRDLLTEDVKAEYSDGKYSYDGVEAVLDFLRGTHAPESGLRSIWSMGHPGDRNYGAGERDGDLVLHAQDHPQALGNEHRDGLLLPRRVREAGGQLAHPVHGLQACARTELELKGPPVDSDRRRLSAPMTRRMRLLLTLGLLATVAVTPSCQSVVGFVAKRMAEFEFEAPPDDMAVLRDIVFAETEHGQLDLDLYTPKARPAEKLPLVVWVYGGGWYVGNKHQIQLSRALQPDASGLCGRRHLVPTLAGRSVSGADPRCESLGPVPTRPR